MLIPLMHLPDLPVIYQSQPCTALLSLNATQLQLDLFDHSLRDLIGFMLSEIIAIKAHNVSME